METKSLAIPLPSADQRGAVLELQKTLIQWGRNFSTDPHPHPTSGEPILVVDTTIGVSRGAYVNSERYRICARITSHQEVLGSPIELCFTTNGKAFITDPIGRESRLFTWHEGTLQFFHQVEAALERRMNEAATIEEQLFYSAESAAFGAAVEEMQFTL